MLSLESRLDRDSKYKNWVRGNEEQWNDINHNSDGGADISSVMQTPEEILFLELIQGNVKQNKKNYNCLKTLISFLYHLKNTRAAKSNLLKSE